MAENAKVERIIEFQQARNAAEAAAMARLQIQDEIEMAMDGYRDNVFQNKLKYNTYCFLIILYF